MLFLLELWRHNLEHTQRILLKPFVIDLWHSHQGNQSQLKNQCFIVMQDNPIL